MLAAPLPIYITVKAINPTSTQALIMHDSTPSSFQQWWRDGTRVLDIANVFDLQPVFKTNSDHQQIEIFSHDCLGRMLVLDGVLHMAEYEYARRELLVHIPLLGRKRKQAKVLLLGGGSGELLSEVLRHDWVHSVTIIEHDATLIEVAKQQLGFAGIFSDPRVDVLNSNANQGVQQLLASKQQYDVIFFELYNVLGQTSDNSLHKTDTFTQQNFSSLLNIEGVVVDWHLVLSTVKNDNAEAEYIGVSNHYLNTTEQRKEFTNIERYQFLSPVLPGGMGVVSLYKKDQPTYSQPTISYHSQHYNPELHSASFALPQWLQNTAIESASRHNQRQIANTGELVFEHTYNTGISQALGMQPLYNEQSDFQTIEYFQHQRFGRVFVLDNTVQGSQADEFIYHEMAVHVPLFGRQRSQVNALIIGGGDGGIVRELQKHDEVKRIVMVEIDDLVVQSSKRYFAVEGDYDDSRVELKIMDAAKYIQQAAQAGERFQLIIVDATDSTEPSSSLWNDAFFNNLSTCLSDDGVCVDSDILIPGRRPQLSRDVTGDAFYDIKRAKRIFPGVSSYFSKIPLFPGGYFVFLLYSKDQFSYTKPWRRYTDHHYNTELHQAAFALPEWWRCLLASL